RTGSRSATPTSSRSPPRRRAFAHWPPTCARFGPNRDGRWTSRRTTTSSTRRRSRPRIIELSSSSGRPRGSPIMSVLDIFAECNKAVVDGVLIKRATRSDKEFHFQNWFAGRLKTLKLNYDPPARNTYPDFRLVAVTIGFELKGLVFPGRIADFDCNSQVPSGLHNGRSIYYVFGRYPKSKENKYPVLDLVVCHGNFLNARHDYIHENKSFRGFGSYGDILVRDR